MTTRVKELGDDLKVDGLAEEITEQTFDTPLENELGSGGERLCERQLSDRSRDLVRSFASSRAGPMTRGLTVWSGVGASIAYVDAGFFATDAFRSLRRREPLFRHVRDCARVERQRTGHRGQQYRQRHCDAVVGDAAPLARRQVPRREIPRRGLEGFVARAARSVHLEANGGTR